jgi:hypothetical protein
MADRTTWINRVGGAAVGAIVAASVTVAAGPDQDYHDTSTADVTAADMDCHIRCAHESGALSKDTTDIKRVTTREVGCDAFKTFVDHKSTAPVDEVPAKARLWKDPCG